MQPKDESQEGMGRHPAGEAQPAEKADTIGALSADIVHDLNNLLMRIDGTISLLLLDKPPDHKDIFHLKKIEKAVERASELIRRIDTLGCRAKDRKATAGVVLAAAPSGVAQKPAPVEGARPALKGILLIEDEEIVASIGEKMLTRLGYRVWVACSGQEGIALYVKHRSGIDLVILDIVMPGMAGGEVLDRLRSINPLVGVLLSSGCSLTGQAMEILKRGCLGFIQKPFSLEQLKQKISQILESR